MKLRHLTGVPDDLRKLKKLLGRAESSPVKFDILLPSEIPRRLEDRFIYGAFEVDLLLGVADVIRACPDRTTALLENFTPHDPELYLQLEELIRNWAGMKRILLGGALLQRQGAVEFFESLGFLGGEKSVLSRKRRHSLKIALKPLELRTPEGAWTVSTITEADVPALGRLMEGAFRGTIDDEGETSVQFTSELRETLRGKYGPWIAPASLVCRGLGGQMVAATVVTIWNEKPLLAYSVTAPAFQGRGLGAYLIGLSMNRMTELGYRELHLGVTEGNLPGQRLYAKLGFT